MFGIILIILIAFSGFFSGVETAFVALSNLRLRHMLEKKANDKNAQIVKKLKKDSHKLISTLLIGNNLVNIAASAIATSLALNYFGSKGIAIATGGMTIAVLIFGEITPKTIAMRHAEKICLLVAKPIYWLSVILTPIIWVLDLITKSITRFFHEKGGKKPLVTEEEIKTFVDIGEEIGSIEKDESEMIKNIFKLNDIEAKDIMTPKINVFAFQEDMSVGEVQEQVVNSPHSRIPLYSENIDKISGILFEKEVMRAVAIGNKDVKLKEIAIEPFFIPETKRADTLLQDFQKKKRHMAVIVDEYGIFTGVVTIEDLLEEIVGEIYDETDVVKVKIKKIDRKTYEIDGDTPLEDVRKKTGAEIENGKEINTISGLVMEKVERIPEKGEIIEIYGSKIEILSMDDQMIAKVRFTKK